MGHGNVLSCPVCSGSLTKPFQKLFPKRGDITVCDKCASILVFDVVLREPTLTELIGWSAEECKRVEKIQSEVMNNRRKE